MAQYFTNFDEYPVGDITTSGQADWAVKIANGTSDFRIIDGGDQDGKFLRVQAAGTNGTRVLGFNPLNGVGDNIETLVKFWIFKSGADGSTGRYGASYTRYGGNSEASTIGYAASFIPVSNVKSLALYEDSTGVVQFSNFAWSMSTDYFIRTRISGNNRYVKIWAASSAEPGSWTFQSTATPPTIASPYSGVGTYQANSYLYVKQYSAGTDGDPAPMFAVSDKPQVGNFQVKKIPTTTIVDGYSGGYGAGYGLGYAAAYYPTATIVTKDQVGQFRVRNTYDKLQVGIFRVKTTSDKTQIGKFRVRITSDKAQVGLFRIASEPLRVQIGKFRVRARYDKTQLGRFVIAALTIRDQLGKFRVQRTYTTTQIGKFRVQNTYTKPQLGQFRVQVTVSRDQAGKFRVTVKRDQAQLGKFSVRKAIDRSQIGKFRVEFIRLYPQVGQFRIYNKNTLPEVIIPVEQYIPTVGNSGEFAEGGTIDEGNYIPNSTEVKQYVATDVDEEGNYR